MKPGLVLLAAVAILAAAVSSTAIANAPSHSAVQQLASPPGVQALYGHARSLTRKGGHYELRFDPAWFLGGVTANRAAIEDKVIPPGNTVSNDYYVRDESHRLLTYLVPATARVTVVTAGPHSTPISVSELAQIVKGRNPKHRSLFEPKNGFWIRVAVDTVRSLDQQYTP